MAGPVVASLLQSIPMVTYMYNISNLAAGNNAITLPAPTNQGSFPPDGQWTPTHVWSFPYYNAAVNTAVYAYADNTSITQNNGAVTFNFWCSNNTVPTSCDVLVF